MKFHPVHQVDRRTVCRPSSGLALLLSLLGLACTGNVSNLSGGGGQVAQGASTGGEVTGGVSGDTGGQPGSGGAPSGGSGGSPGTGGSSATGGKASTGGATGGAVSSTGGAPAQPVPVILSFAATPPSLPSGGGQTALSWSVQNADSVSIDKGVGAVTGSSTNVNVTATTIYTLTATNSHGKSSASTAVVIGQNQATGTIGRFVQMVSPIPGEAFIAPTKLRLIAAGRDPKIDTNTPSSGLGGNAAQVQFFVDDQNVLTVDGGNAEYWIFKGFAGSLAAGSHRVWARATYVNPDEVLDSVPVIVNVAAPPTYGKTVDLTDDVTVGSGGYSLVGTATSRVRLNGHGHKITGSGALTLQFVDVFDLGSTTDTSQPGINLTTSAPLVIEDSTFDGSNPISVSLGGTATASVRRNVFRSNMRQPLGQNPNSSNPGGSFGAIHFDGSSTGAKVFAGNNVGAGWVELINAKQWTVGGDTDADSNILIGPRVGIYPQDSSNMTVRRNYSHHVYFGGWSQGANMEIFGTTNSTIEHNVINDSSWPVRGGGNALEFRYNLVLMAGHEWMQPAPGSKIHHNLFVGGDEDQGGVFVYNSNTSPNAAMVSLYNNTLDGLSGQIIMSSIRMANTSGPVDLSSNAFLNYPHQGSVVQVDGGTLTADYNGFFACSAKPYSDARKPAHDVTAANAQLTSPPTAAFTLGDGTIWNRSTTVANILAVYRTNYTPKSGSPVLGAGDPKTTSGNWIGAIGGGQADLDKFGRP